MTNEESLELVPARREAPLVPVEERAIDFYGDTIVALLVRVEGQQQVYVPVRPLCEYLGLSWTGQRQRIYRDEVLMEALRFVCVTHTNLGGDPEALALPLDYLPGWLFGISANRVRKELQEKILRYRRECFRVLWQAFQSDALALVEQRRSQHEPSASLVQIREMGLAIAQMAEQQMALDQRVSSVDARMDRAAEVVAELRRRLGTLERRVEPSAGISEEQAAELSSRVKALAELLTIKQGAKNHYQGIFAELYRRFGVSSYKLISLEHYQPVLAFLEDWRRSAVES